MQKWGGWHKVGWAAQSGVGVTKWDGQHKVGWAAQGGVLSRMDFRLFEVKINQVQSGFECGLKIRLELKLSRRRETIQFDGEFGVGS